jgi:hypothetical protein
VNKISPEFSGWLLIRGKVGRGRVHSPDEKQDVLCKPHEHETEYSICITQAEGRVTQQPIVRLLTAALPGPACFTQLPSRLEIISHKDKCHYRSLGRVPLLLVTDVHDVTGLIHDHGCRG